MKFRARSLFTLFMVAVFTYSMVEASGWIPRASIMVVGAGGLGLLMVLGQLYLDSRPGEVTQREILDVSALGGGGGQWIRILIICSWIIGLFFSIYLVGFQVGLPLFVFAYSKVQGAKWWMSFVMAAAILVLLYGLFDQLAHVIWPTPLLLPFLGG